MDGGSPRPPRRPEREGSYNCDIESMDGSVAGGGPPWRSQNGSAEALLRYDDGGAGDRGSTREPLLRKRTMNTTSQIAIVGANVCPIESLDYEVVENDLFKQDWRSRKKKQIFQYIVLKWSLVLLIGLLTGLVGFFNNLAVENIAGLKLLHTSRLMLKERYFKAFFVYGGCNLVLAASAAAICAYVAPAAAGSGIPEVKAYLNGVDAYSILAPSTLFVKIFGSILGVSAGFVLGKEGPMVHTGACIANLLGQGGSRKYHLTCNWLRYFKNDRDRRDLITCGSAAGVAAAFRAPVGGVLFALEEAASWWRSALLWRTFFTTAVVAVVLRGLIEFCRSGKCGLFGQGGLIMFDLSSTIATYSTPDLIAIIVLGIIGGIFGGLFNFLLDKILRVYSIINERGAPFKILLTITISIVTSMCSYGLPWLAACTPCPADAVEQCPTISRSGNYKNFQCPQGYYNDLASLFFNTNDDAIRNLFSNGTANEFRMSSLFIFFTAIYCLGLVTYGVAVPSGLFIPVILAGATYGRIVGTLLGSISDLDPGLFALLGAASFLGGTMRMTVSIVVMKGFPYMEAHAEPYMRHLVAGDVVSGPLITFSGVEKVGNIVHALRITGHNGFPVVDEPPITETPELVGLVTRSHLLVLLNSKNFMKGQVKTSGSFVLRRFGAFDFAKPGSGKGLKIEDLDFTDEEMDMYVDLHPITNTSPYTVVETMSLAKAAILFRELGLRHLLVVPKTPDRPPIVGILTRHDFMPEHIHSLFPNLNPHKYHSASMAG
ncbi:hypothetical protein PVAP13_1KG333000 [Panicum virgatum]|uniref:Chloride channel protein n=1 Tax=Panicum virgatum TaxID=38727 RepID=A0A8T0XIS5_PANVG|nr:hypothetical protein PVAP13_1KG333000 [Panicum virgatum]